MAMVGYLCTDNEQLKKHMSSCWGDCMQVMAMMREHIVMVFWWLFQSCRC